MDRRLNFNRIDMKEIQLTQGYIALIDDEDFERVSKINWHVHKSRQRRYGRNKKIGYLHNFIMNTPEDMEVNHKDWDGLNCQKYNMENTTRSKNAQNMHRTREGFVGVYYDNRDKTIFSSIGFAGKNIYIGRFNSEVEAAIAYNSKAIELFGSNAQLNKVD
jgi:hypothetical protein